MSDTARPLLAMEALREPWEELDRQREAASFGMWVFLASELLFFSGLFVSYAVYRTIYPEAMIAGARHADFFYGTLNTAILMTSSLTMVLASRGAEAGLRRFALWCLAATILLGLGFVVVKGFEYAKDIEDHLLVGYNYDLKPPESVLFWCFYWVSTGLHAVHVSIGIALIARLLIQGLRSALPLQTTPQLEATALYWHLVDTIWIFLYPCIYLVGRAS